MQMISKYNGTCKACDGPIVKGALINWSRADGARHVTPGQCVAAVEFKAVAQTNPVVQTVVKVDKGSVTGFLQMAQGRGLKSPKVRFLAPSGGELRLSLAGGNTRYPGAVQVKVDGTWVGRIEADGRLTPGLARNPKMVDTLAAIADRPADMAKAYGAMMSKCSFCGKALTDAGSVDVGYGPDCAARYGLPHTPKGTPAVKQVLAAEGFNDAAQRLIAGVPTGRPGRLSAIVAQMEVAA